MDIPDTAARVRHRSDDESIRELFGDTVEHSRNYIAAQKDALTLRARITAAIVKTAVAFGSIAIVLALFGLSWVLAAAVGALALLIGYVLAALAVGLLLLLAAFLCVRRVMSTLSRLPGTSS